MYQYSWDMVHYIYGFLIIPFAQLTCVKQFLQALDFSVHCFVLSSFIQSQLKCMALYLCLIPDRAVENEICAENIEMSPHRRIV